MSEDSFERILKDTKKYLSERVRPKVRCDKDDIFVTCDFNQGNIKKVRFKASKKDWLQLTRDRYKKDFLFDDISQYLSRPNQKIKTALQKYSEKYPTLFFDDFWNCIEATIENNPLIESRVKTRKPSQYDLSWSEKNEITALASRLYIYLQKISKQSKKTWPDYFHDFLSSYEILEIELEADLQGAIRKIVSIYFGIEFKDRFWQTFVTDRGISLRRLKKCSHRIDPDQDLILSDLFKEFKN
jgi:hypothetical protein